MRRLMKRHRGEKGFTLIELLIVVAILGILAAVVIPNVSGFLVTGQLNAANTEAENVKTAVIAYYAEYGVWPATSAALIPNFISGTPKATYTITNGFLAGTSESTWPTAITFSGGSGTAHGTWKRV